MGNVCSFVRALLLDGQRNTYVADRLSRTGGVYVQLQTKACGNGDENRKREKYKTAESN